MDSLRDSAFGELVRYFSGNKYFAHLDEKILLNNDNEAAALFSNSQQETAETLTTKISNFNTVTLDNGEVIRKVDWYTSDDQENPQNWTNGKKSAIICLLGFVTFTVYLGSAIYTPGVEEIMEKFNVGYVAAQLPLTLYAFGYGTGPMFFSPLSENPKIGRSPIFVVTLFLFSMMQIPTALVNNFAGLNILRFIAGVLCSPALSVCGAVVGDVFSFFVVPYILPVWAAFCMVGPFGGPLIGAALIEAKNYRWTFWILMWLSMVSFILTFFYLPETLASRILHKKAERIRRIEAELMQRTGEQGYPFRVFNDVEKRKIDAESSKTGRSGEKSSHKTHESGLQHLEVPNTDLEAETSLGVKIETTIVNREAWDETDRSSIAKVEDIVVADVESSGGDRFISWSPIKFVSISDVIRSARLASVGETEIENVKWSSQFKEMVLRPFAIIMVEPGVLFLDIYIGLIYAIMYSWFEAFPILFAETYHFTLVEIGVVFVSLTIGFVSSAIFYVAYVIRKLIVPHLKNAFIHQTEPFSPERFIKYCIYAAACAPPCLLFFGWSATASVHWIAPTIAAVITVAPMLIIFQLTFIYLGSSYPRYMASVFGGNALVRSYGRSLPPFRKIAFC